MYSMNQPKEGLSSIAGGILTDVQDLVRQEVRLAKAEAREEISKVVTASISFAVAGLLGLLAVIHFSLGLVYAIFHFSEGKVPIWGSYAILTLILAAAGGAFFLTGKKKLTTVDFVPRKTISTIKDNYDGLRRSN